MLELLNVAKSFGTAHKYFLQILLKEKIILFSEGGYVFQQLAEKYENLQEKQLTTQQNNELVKVLLNVFNEKLRIVGMRLLEIPDETRLTTNYLALVTDRNYSEILSTASGFTFDELAVFQAWLIKMYHHTDGIKTQDNTKYIGEIDYADVLNSRVGSLSASGAQKLINKLINMQWLIVDEKRDVLRLHPRALAELSNCLQSEYNLLVCDLCTKGIFLSRLAHQCECGYVYHVRCIKKVLNLPSKCQNRKCQKMLTNELISVFDFDKDSQNCVLNENNFNYLSTSETDETNE